MLLLASADTPVLKDCFTGCRLKNWADSANQRAVVFVFKEDYFDKFSINFLIFNC